MRENKLKMNTDKTEVIVFGSRHQCKKLKQNFLTVIDAQVKCQQTLKYLGAELDMHMTMHKQISKKCQVAAWNLGKIRKIRQYLTEDACKIMIQSMVIAHLDYANCLYAKLPNEELKRLQKLQNMAARLILHVDRRSSATESLKCLHWLPIRQRIIYKIVVLVYKCVHGSAPKYLSDIIIMHNPRRITRRTLDPLLLEVPSTKRSTFADRSFSVFGPRQWNKLPLLLRQSKSLDTFKSGLKTHLFVHADI
jgi:hypothetical protein